ncbi:MAG: (d)CMP kinase [Firmicutes bacterium]|nr:(d)CMP kinase [Bacillota bacterium]MDY5041977.1 (d)CMP kinase [Eubacteriales bacterium]
MINIAIDGPSASGKGAVAQRLAKLLNVYHLDTGAIYRAIGLYCYENNVDPYSEEEVAKVLDKMDIVIDFVNNEQYTYLNGECVNSKIRTSIISDYSSRSSALKIVRDKVRNIQQDFARNNNVIMEGRDITTEILPNAKYKFYLTASPEVRAKRRLKDLIAKGENVTFEKVLEDINERDYRDTHRQYGKLELAKDAIYVNTDEYNIDEVVAILYSKIDERV